MQVLMKFQIDHSIFSIHLSLIILILERCPHDPCLHVYKLQTHLLKIQNPYAKTKFQRSFGACICAFGASHRNLPISQKRASGACIVALKFSPFGAAPARLLYKLQTHIFCVRNLKCSFSQGKPMVSAVLLLSTNPSKNFLVN